MRTNVRKRTTAVRAIDAPAKELLRLSPNGIKAFESCRARYIYTYVILPRMDLKQVQAVTKTGRIFHELAEMNFDETVMKTLLYQEKRSLVAEITEFTERIKSRAYFGLPAATEVHLKAEVSGCGTFHGIADRICREDDRYTIVDLKTSANPDPDSDRRQLMGYAWLLNANHGIHPVNIRLVLDYIRKNELYQHTLTLADLKHYELYLAMVFRKVDALVKEFAEHRTIGKVAHTPGECFGCPVIGSCEAYRLTMNPGIKSGDIEETTTRALADELREREMVIKQYEERAKAIKTALLTRHKAGDGEVAELFKIIESRQVVFPSRDALLRMIDKIIWEAVQDDRFRFKIDTAKIGAGLTELLLGMLPENLAAGSIPEAYLALVDDLKSVVNRSPYLKAIERGAR